MRKSFSIGTLLFLLYVGLTLFQRGKDSHVVQFRTTGIPSIDLKQKNDLVGVINKFHLDNIPHEDNAAVGLLTSGLLPEYFSHSDQRIWPVLNSLGIDVKGKAKSPMDTPELNYVGRGRSDGHAYWFNDWSYEQKYLESMEKLPPNDSKIRRFLEKHNQSLDKYSSLVSRDRHIDYFEGRALHLAGRNLISLHGAYLRVLTLRIRFALSQNRIANAIKDCHVIHRLQCMLINDMTMEHALFGLSGISQVMPLWCQILSHPSTTVNDLENIRQRISTLPKYSCINALDFYERLVALEYLRLVEQYGLSQPKYFVGDIPFNNGMFAYLQLGGMAFVDWHKISDRVNQHIDNCINILELQDQNDRRVAIQSLENDKAYGKDLTKGSDNPNPFNVPDFSTDLVWRMIENYFLDHSTMTTRLVIRHSTEDLVILSTCIAIKQFQLDHERYPTSLEELLDKYISDIPYDFNAGTSVSYIPLEEGGLIYTVGRNQRDDQGWGDDVTFLIGEDHRGLQETSR